MRKWEGFQSIKSDTNRSLWKLHRQIEPAQRIVGGTSSRPLLVQPTTHGFTYCERFALADQVLVLRGPFMYLEEQLLGFFGELQPIHSSSCSYSIPWGCPVATLSLPINFLPLSVLAGWLADLDCSAAVAQFLILSTGEEQHRRLLCDYGLLCLS